MDLSNQNIGEIVLYQPDETIRLEVRVEDETVWLTQAQMAELFQTSVPNVNMHIKNIFKEGELEEDSVIKESLITAADGKNYRTKHYNLDVIISTGYRVKSLRGTSFRRWATKTLKEYLLKGFVLNQRIERIESFAIETRRMVENIAIESFQHVTEIREKVEFLARYVEDILSDFNDINEDTRMQLNEIYQALTELAERRKELDRPRNPIGFIQHKKN